MEIELETVNTPSSYLRTLPEGKTLGKTMQVWYVQEALTGIKGVITNIISPEDAFDAEPILLGFAPGKAYEAVGIGRHGNFLQWGYAAAPSQMTPAGQNLFVNCICYIHKFDGRQPLARNQALSRSRFLRYTEYFVEKPQSAARFLSAELMEKHQDNIEPLMQSYRDNIGLLYQAEDGRYYIDEELKSLGFETNNDPANLDKLIELLSDTEKATKARALLNRYTGNSFKNPQQWRQWLDAARNRLIFSDSGGYRFFVLPERK